MKLEDYTFGEKISDLVYRFGSSWWFILMGVGIIVLWILINCFCYLAFDNYPYILLNLFLSLIAAFQAPFIMMSQRRCEIKQDLIYRSLFKEIKELIETDLAIEEGIVEQNQTLLNEIADLKEIILRLKDN